jgi:putative endonuclease
LKWNEKTTTTVIGSEAELKAYQYLTLQKLTLLEQNYHSKYGEIDLIMLDASCYVFVEVKYRKNNTFGGGVSAVDANKQRKIRLCAQHYLQQKQLNEYNTACRFDIITLVGSLQAPKINWIKNAF